MLTTGLSLEVVRQQLKESHFFNGTLDELGLPYDEAIAAEVLAQAVGKDLVSPPDDEIIREKRVMAVGCQVSARKLLAPLITQLFNEADPEDDVSRWTLFGVNYYSEGAVFREHRDYNNSEIATSVIVSLSGVRSLTVEGNSPVKLMPKSVTLLDGRYNPLHSARCLDAPSVSIVANVPALI